MAFESKHTETSKKINASTPAAEPANALHKFHDNREVTRNLQRSQHLANNYLSDSTNPIQRYFEAEGKDYYSEEDLKKNRALWKYINAQNPVVLQKIIAWANSKKEDKGTFKTSALLVKAAEAEVAKDAGSKEDDVSLFGVKPQLEADHGVSIEEIMGKGTREYGSIKLAIANEVVLIKRCL